MGVKLAVRQRLRIRGVVQGVGFRPYVHRMATGLGLAGHVGNDVSGVFVEVEGSADAVERLVSAVRAGGPPLARVESVTVEALPLAGEESFRIVASRGPDAVAPTFVAPDTAICDDCLRELFDPTDRRHGYPFITCTNCGPRFTITKRLPYDRPNTTMAGFAMCDACATEYHDPTDRRFHAQPIACWACGPTLAGGGDPVAEAQAALATGAIVAVKGLGGYHLACSAWSDAAVALLRERKGRGDKPFAVMVRDLALARRLAVVSDDEARLLASPARPIVLLDRLPGSGLAVGVAPGLTLLGVMLPYTPLHHLLLAAPGPDVVVMTSGNLGDEPIAYEDDDARRRLAGLADAWLTHDRPIHVPCDDSVVRVVDGAELPIRRSRGYAPLPIALPPGLDPAPSLAVGGELKTTFCLARGRHAWVSQHLGDMGSIETLAAFERSADQFAAMYGAVPEQHVADLHPGYHTRQWVERRASTPVLVQHHHAHLASLLAEHGVPAGVQVLGAVFDGTGYGPDGAIWGGELLLADYAGFERVAHVSYAPLPGGDSAIRKPYRAALAHLWAAGMPWDGDLAPVVAAGADELVALRHQLERNVRCVPTSSMGRLFDAVASILDVRHQVTYEAQAAMALEALASSATTHPELAFGGDGGAVIGAVVEGVRGGADRAALAYGFHETIARWVGNVAEQVGVPVVGLTGGVFQNALLVRLTRAELTSRGFAVLTHRVVPPNDGGLALGQLAVAAAGGGS